MSDHPQQPDPHRSSAFPSPGPDAICLWSISVQDAVPYLDACMVLLTEPERERAGRQRAGRVREQFVVARACLRVLLGAALGSAPSAIAIVEDAHGKPHTPQGGHQSIAYNLAHSGGWIVIGLRRGGVIGVDLEWMDRETDPLSVAEAAFHPEEVARLASIPDAARQRREFFACWVRREAVAKADGRGLSLPAASMQVPVGAAAWTTVQVESGRPDRDRAYAVCDVDLRADFAAAVAVDGVPGPILQRSFLPGLAFGR